MVYFKVLFTYGVLIILFSLGVIYNHPGAVDGIIYFFKPSFGKLGEAKVNMNFNVHI